MTTRKQYVIMVTSSRKEWLVITRKNLNTPIEVNVLETFKNTCSKYGLPMNTIIECLLKEFNEGNYTITLSKNGVSLKRED